MSADLTAAVWLAAAACASIVLVLLYYRSVLFGFTFYAFFNIATASLAGVLFASATGLSRGWVTPEHLAVFSYSSYGLIAFSAGVALAWLPLRGLRPAQIWRAEEHGGPPPWLSPWVIVACLGASVISSLLAPLLADQATLRTFWESFRSLLPFAVLMATIHSGARGDYRLFFLSLAAFVPLAMLGAVLSGHIGVGGTFLIQLLLVACFGFGVRVRSAVVFALGLALLTSLILGWMNSRALIRSGSLDSYSPTERVGIFLREFEYTSPLDLRAEDVQGLLRLRVDMSDILAAQVSYQPELEPYSYGGTLFADLAAALIPRVLWPEKPTFSGGSQFVARYTGLEWEKGTSVGLPYQFELYANGGPAAVIVGLLALGWLVARLELSLVRRRRSLPAFLALMYATAAVAAGAQTLVTLVTSLLAGVLAYAVLGRLLAGMEPRLPGEGTAEATAIAPHPPLS